MVVQAHDYARLDFFVRRRDRLPAGQRFAEYDIHVDGAGVIVIDAFIHAREVGIHILGEAVHLDQAVIEFAVAAASAAPLSAVVAGYHGEREQQRQEQCDRLFHNYPPCMGIVIRRAALRGGCPA